MRQQAPAERWGVDHDGTLRRATSIDDDGTMWTRYHGEWLKLELMPADRPPATQAPVVGDHVGGLMSIPAYQRKAPADGAGRDNILTVGWRKGELDFGVRATIQDLSIEEMQAFRAMVMVAIGAAESMWGRARSQQLGQGSPL